MGACTPLWAGAGRQCLHAVLLPPVVTPLNIHVPYIMQDRYGCLPQTSSSLSSTDSGDSVTSLTVSLLQMYLRQRTKPQRQPRFW